MKRTVAHTETNSCRKQPRQAPETAAICRLLYSNAEEGTLTGKHWNSGVLRGIYASFVFSHSVAHSFYMAIWSVECLRKNILTLFKGSDLDPFQTSLTVALYWLATCDSLYFKKMS